MIKKIGMWVVYAGIVGLLIFGGVNRTLAKSGQDESQNTGLINEAASKQSRGGEGNKQSTDQGVDGDYEAYLEEGDWIELTGTIMEIDAIYLRVQLDGGDILEAEGRLWRFVQESGYQAVVGNEIELTGFYENGEFEISRLCDISSGVTVLLRDDSGRPLWRGGGRN